MIPVNPGCAKRGSKALADRIVERYLALGGKVETGCEVTRVSIDGKRVTQLTTADGRSFTADHYVAACDAHTVLERLLGGRYRVPAFDKRLNDPTTYPLASNTYIGLGLQADVGEMPRTVRSSCVDERPEHKVLHRREVVRARGDNGLGDKHGHPTIDARIFGR